MSESEMDRGRNGEMGGEAEEKCREREVCLFLFGLVIGRCSTENERSWFSGIILACHARDPGSIPGGRILFPL
jgi:hypothetical protein